MRSHENKYKKSDDRRHDNDEQKKWECGWQHSNNNKYRLGKSQELWANIKNEKTYTTELGCDYDTMKNFQSIFI